MTRRSAAVVLGAFTAFLVLLVLVRAGWDPLLRLDTRIDAHLNDFYSRHRDAAAWWRRVSTAGQPLTFQVGAAVGAGLLWFAGRLRDALFVAISVLGAGVLSTVVKRLVDRQRPSPAKPLTDVSGPSFPSGHALTSSIALGVLVLVTAGLLHRWLWRALVAVAALAAVAIGFSRLALGVHYPSDVVGAWLLAAAWVGAISAALASSAARSVGVSRPMRR